MTWDELILAESKKQYFKNIFEFLKHEDYFPKEDEIFNAFSLTPFENVKVVIIGQDPYHEENQAHGLAFSVKSGKTPKSLQNIFIEMKNDLNIERTNTDLTLIAKQGVLLLNTTLTVRKHEANSHKNIGWNIFTNKVIEELNKSAKPIIFILWGNDAISKVKLIDQNKHYILSSAHPSFFSANKGFFGSKVFSKTNDILIKNGYKPIDWSK